MLKVWRSKTTIFAECTACGSYGTANHLQPRVQMTPEIEAAVERHTAHMLALRSHYTTAANAIVNKIRTKEITRKEGSDKIRTLWENHVAQVRLGEASLPDPDGKVKEMVAACPWCEAVEDEIEVEKLPDDIPEPKFAQARDPRPAQQVTSKGA
jgi:hypothetical protein